MHYINGTGLCSRLYRAGVMHVGAFQAKVHKRAYETGYGGRSLVKLPNQHAKQTGLELDMLEALRRNAVKVQSNLYSKTLRGNLKKFAIDRGI